jgi:signal transduction histidine kinase/CheY-like chemotaxis protein
VRDESELKNPTVIKTFVNQASVVFQRIQAEEENKRIQFQLLQSQKMEAVGVLAGGVAHDFNNLLTTILGNADLAMGEVNESDTLYSDLEEIKEAAVRAASLTRQLLLFSRKQPMGYAPLNINNTVEDLLRMLNRLIEEDVTIDTDFESDIRTVVGDKGTIEQVITNLAVNARDAMPRGGKITIRTKNVILDRECCEVIPESRPGEFICLSVSDAGVGMDKETIKRIFEPFFTTKGGEKGTGLGLSVIYGIIRQHKGWINVYSEAGQGTTFKIYLPATSSKVEDKTKEKIVPKEFRSHGEKILLVEDDESIRKYVITVLASNGYVVSEANGVKEALGIFEKEGGDFQLVLSDVVLTDGLGLELVERLLLLKSQLGVILSSGYLGEKSQWSVIREKGYLFLQKPFASNDLLEAVRETLGKKVKIYGNL